MYQAAQDLGLSQKTLAQWVRDKEAISFKKKGDETRQRQAE